VFGILPTLVGVSTENVRASGELTATVLRPWLETIESQLDEALVADVYGQQSVYGRIRLALSLPIDVLESADALTKITGQAAVLTANEARELIGLPPVEGGDDLLQPLNAASKSVNELAGQKLRRVIRNEAGQIVGLLEGVTSEEVESGKVRMRAVSD
jgi:phage portal protein BeeE